MQRSLGRIKYGLHFLNSHIWAAFKLYISRSFQLFKEPCLKGLENYFKSIFHGESEATISNVKLALSLQD